MTIVFRDEKGSPLTSDEVDENFHDLDDRTTALEDSAPEPNQISNVTIDGTTLTFHLEGGGSYSVTVPQAAFRPSIVTTLSASTFTPTITNSNCYKLCTNAGGCVVSLTSDIAADIEFTFDADTDGVVSFIEGDTAASVEPPTGFLAETAVRGAVVTAKSLGSGRWRLIGLLAEDTTS